MRKSIRHTKRGGLPKGKRPSRPLATLFILLLVWSILLGWGMAIALGASVKPDIIAQAAPAQLGTVDPIPARYQLGVELYQENCSSCHVAIPPEVLPSETWRQLLLEQQQHFGQKLEPMIGPEVVIMWDYLRTFSRPKVAAEPTPYRVSESRYFKALHPQVDLPQPTRPASCVTCHPGAAKYDYRTLTPEWGNSG